MNRPSSLAAVCLLLTGCPFTPEDLELTAGSPALGTGGPAGPQGGPMSEPDLNALVPAQTQEELLATAHRMLRGTVEGTCAVSVRIDVLRGRQRQETPVRPPTRRTARTQPTVLGPVPDRGGKPTRLETQRAQLAQRTPDEPVAGTDPGGPPDEQVRSPHDPRSSVRGPPPRHTRGPLAPPRRALRRQRGRYLTHSDVDLASHRPRCPQRRPRRALLVLAESGCPAAAVPGVDPGGPGSTRRRSRGSTHGSPGSPVSGPPPQ